MKKILCILISTILLIVALSACSSDVTVTVNFMVDGVQIHTASTEQGKIPTLPSDPTKEGFTFDAWYYDDGVWEKPLTVQSFLDLPITEKMEISVYAHFNDNKTEPPIDESAFNDAVAIYKTHNPLYIGFDVKINEVNTASVEWYETDRFIMVKTIAVLNEPPVMYYYDKALNKKYSIDKDNQRLVETEVSMQNLVPIIEGAGTSGVVTIQNKVYDSLNFVANIDSVSAGDIFLKFVKDNGTLHSIVIADNNSMFFQYLNITISTSLPETSAFDGVDEYQRIEYISYMALTDSMSPALQKGNTYKFKTVDVSSLAVGDIILVNSKIGEQTTRFAHRIVEIRNNEGVLTFILKGDANVMADSTTYHESDIIGILVETLGGGGEPNPELMTNITISSDNVNEYFDISIIPPMAGEATSLVLVSPNAKFEKLLQDDISAESTIITVTVNIKQYLARDNSLSQNTNQNVIFSYNRTWLDNSIHWVSEFSQSVYLGENPTIVSGTDPQTGNPCFVNKYKYEGSIGSVSVSGKTTFLCRENG